MKNLRNTIKQQRLALTAEQQAEYSAAIASHLFSLSLFQQSQHIACYLSHQGEVATTEIINAIWQAKKQCYLPIINSDKTLSFIHYTPDTRLIPNQFGILEPELNSASLIDVQKLDLVLTPLVAFNKNCFRAGWGLGHYDRTFAFLLKKNRPSKPFLIGLAYYFQLSENIKIESWDVPLDLVITENKIY